ncbi:MAG: bifunctional metallophosphatase/5'-nucleotidase [Mycobacteriales bacterium]
MGPFRRFAPAVAAATLLAGLSGGTAAAGHDVDLQILALDDFHSALLPSAGPDGQVVDDTGAIVPAGGAAYLATHLAALRAGHRDSLTVSTGDNIGSTAPLSAVFGERPAIGFLRAAGVGLSAAGNHDFDDGPGALARFQREGFPYLSANVTRDGAPVLAPYAVRRFGGVPVGFVGATTSTTPALDLKPSGIAGLAFGAEVPAVNRAVAALRRRGVHAIVLLLHEGDTAAPDARPNSCTVTAPGNAGRIARQVDADVDVVLSGHTHQQYVCTVPGPDGRPRLFTQPASFGTEVTEVDLRLDRRTGDVVRGAARAANHVVTRTVRPDPATTASLARWQRRLAPVLAAPVGSATAAIPALPGPTAEIPAGELVADSEVAAFHGRAQLALVDPHLVTGGLPAGTVSYGTARAVQAGGTDLGLVTLTGAQLRQVLEQQFRSGQEVILQPSSELHVTVDRGRPPGQRVTAVTVAGRPLDDAAPYRVAASYFLLRGLDGFAAFTAGSGRTVGPPDVTSFLAYVGAHSPLSPPPAGRITVVAELPGTAIFPSFTADSSRGGR